MSMRCGANSNTRGQGIRPFKASRPPLMSSRLTSRSQYFALANELSSLAPLYLHAAGDRKCSFGVESGYSLRLARTIDWQCVPRHGLAYW